MYDVTSTALQTSNTPNSTADVCKSASAPATQRSSTPRNVRFYLTPATILQQTAATRPPALPCEPHLLTSFPPSQFPVQKERREKDCLRFFPVLRVYSVPGQAFSQSASAVLGYGQHSWLTPPTKSAFPAPRCAVCSASCARVRTCAPSLAMRCAPNLRGILMAVHGCTDRYVTPKPSRMGRGKAQLLQHRLSWATSRLRCYRETSTSASASRVTRVRAKSFFGPSHLYLSYSSGMGRRWHGLLYEYPQRAWRTFYDLCVSSFSPLPRFFIACSPNVFHTVRFKVIADDGTVILIPCEASPVGNR